MKYAIIKLGGKQFNITEGQTIKIERQSLPLNIDVLVYSNGAELSIGEPVLNDITINTTVNNDKRDRKIRVGRFRAKSRHRRIYGHKQPLSFITVNKIFKKGETSEDESNETTTKVVKAKAVKKVSKVAKKPVKKSAAVTKVKKPAKVSKKLSKKEE